jgi:hypothetical protein
MGWYALALWDAGNLPLMAPPPPGWESKVSPFAGMRCPRGTFLRPKGAIAYQPGV